MTPEQTDLATRWEKSHTPKKLRAFAATLIRTRFHDALYICAISDDLGKPTSQGTLDFMAIRESEIKSPFHCPYFMVCTDSHLMLARMLIPQLKAWDFKTTKKVIR